MKYSVLTGAAALALASTAGIAGAPKKADEREPVTATGNDLLKMIADNGGSMMLTQEEGASIVEGGFATVNTDKVEGNTAEVSLTEAGQSAVAALTDGSSRSAGFEVDDAVPVPTGSTRRGRTGGYPFESLQVGQSFHVPATPDNPNPAARLQSSVSGARAKFAEEIPGETETFMKKTYKRAADGKGFEKDAEGKRIVESEVEETRPATRLTRDFKVAEVDASDPRGPGARVWRIEVAA